MSLKVKSFILSITFIPLAIIGQILGKVISSFSCNLLSIPGGALDDEYDDAVWNLEP